MIALWIGFFSLVMGLLTYDSEVVTAPVPVVSGGIVIILAVLGWIPEPRRCPACGKMNLGRTDRCSNCGAKLKS